MFFVHSCPGALSLPVILYLFHFLPELLHRILQDDCDIDVFYSSGWTLRLFSTDSNDVTIKTTVWVSKSGGLSPLQDRELISRDCVSIVFIFPTDTLSGDWNWSVLGVH